MCSNQGRNDGQRQRVQFPRCQMTAGILTMSKVGYSTSMQYICFRQTSGSNMGGPNLLLAKASCKCTAFSTMHYGSIRC